MKAKNSLWNEIRLWFAEWLLALIVLIAPAKTDDGRKLILMILAYCKSNRYGEK